MSANDRSRDAESEPSDSSLTQSAENSIKADAPAMPANIGRYRIYKQIGRGGFGIVYLAFDDRLNRRVAIKVPHSNLVSQPNSAQAYLSEARTIANLEHPGIVPVYDFGSTDEFPCFIVMKYIEGTDLRSHIALEPLSHQRSAKLIATVALALHHAHTLGFIHRDLKPGNILIDKSDRPCVVDFGLALCERDMGTGPHYAGTAAYMSPEQASGEGHRVDGRSDIYSLGAVFYELLVGRKTVSGRTTTEILEQVRFREAKPLRQIKDNVPRELERICLKALAKRASERYTTALDLAEDLKHFLDSQPGHARPDEGSANQLHVPGDSSSDLSTNVIPKGLRSFESHDADFFLSLLPGPRDREGLPECIRFWKIRLEETDSDQTFSVGLIYGPSGCGKSSIVKAGLLPRLSTNVIPFFVEATAGNTEAELLRLLRKRWCSAEDNRTLPELVAALRRGEGPPQGKKIVLVLDQFEQWLHASTGYEQAELVQALRQCDGGRVQCILLVRDDFWLAVSLFMRALETRLIEGHNSAMVDLFDHEHAKRVLTAFGRAYGKLPRASHMSREQTEFLERAVSTLSDDGKVISVRLALFAEMMKDRIWSPAALEAVGGTTGIGVAFLEQTFATSTAPPKYRFHQNAAAAVLKALLPEVGVDIKGEMKSEAALREVSGYEQRRQDFDELIHILDNELRLIAPTDTAISSNVSSDISSAKEPNSPATSERFYQLTHDYLVQSLREWLTRKQKTTHRGRAELRLAERTAIWKGKRETRLLPPWWEWVNIRLLTQSRDWTATQRQMMRKMDRYLTMRGLVLALCACLLLGLVWETNGRRRARSLIETLKHAPTHEVPAIVDNMADFRRWVDPDLQDAFASAEIHKDPRRELHLRLALLPGDGDQVQWLTDKLLRSTPEEVAVIRTSLAAHVAEVQPALWTVLESDPSFDHKLRAAAFLASTAPQDERWGDVSDDVLAKLNSENSLLIKEWVALLQPAGPKMLPALAEMIASNKRSTELRPLAELYAEFASDAATGFAPLEEVLHRAAAGTQAQTLPSARRQANAAAALAIALRWDAVWPMLRAAPDPTLRTQLIALLGANNIVSPDLNARLASDIPADASIRYALVLALGDLSDDRWAMSERIQLRPLLENLLATEDDPAVHSALTWTLQRWETLDDQARENDAARKALDMVVVTPGKIEIPKSDGGSRTLSVTEPYAISRTEVTFREFQNFRLDQAWDRRAAPVADCPVHEVSWYDAAAYCNWLSNEALLPRDQWCYEPNRDGEYAAGMLIKGNALQLTGYRLATAAEWEYACRAGTVTTWSIGENTDMLDRYAWSMANSGIHSHPVAQLRPNDLGLFDMHGNVWEWCHDRVNEQGEPITLTDDHRVVDSDLFALRGGTYMTDPMSLGSASLNWNPVGKHTNADGLRVAQSLK